VTWRALPGRLYAKGQSCVVGQCRLTLSNPSRTRAWFQRLKLICDEPLSNFAFNFNLRRYSVAALRIDLAHVNTRTVLLTERVGASQQCSPRHPPHSIPVLATSSTT